MREKDPPWIMRTYSGHSSPEASNELYKKNLAKGQTGLSVAFDLPTQTGYDADHPLARGEVGRVGVPIGHLGDLRALFDGLDLERMNTSMTINATAAWLIALYVATAEGQGADVSKLRGTTQNDIIKEYLSRGTYVFPPGPSLRLTADTILFTVEHVPEWNPINICSYHLQEAGATPEQEVAYALTTATAVLDSVRDRGVEGDALAQVFSRISFFLNSSLRFVEETCKARAFVELWERLGRERYGVTDERALRFRYGVQVNSLGLTEAQPENNVVRIAFEMLGVTLSKKARARAIQLPAWNEALGLPRPWDQQLALRTQQVLAYETDLLEYEDLLDGSPVVEKATRVIADAAWAEVESVLGRGGAVEAVESGYIKEQLVASHAARRARIERGEEVVVGVNRFTESAASPLTGGGSESILRVDPRAERDQVASLRAWREQRDEAAVRRALDDLRRAADRGENLVPVSVAAAKAGVTTGEWGEALRGAFGEYRAPTGVAGARVPPADAPVEALRSRIAELESRLGRRPKILVGKPGLDGHSNGAEQIALRARDAGFEVVYEGIRVTPAQIARAAADEGVHLVGLSILSGAHVDLVGDVAREMKKLGLDDVPLVAGGIIPEADVARLRELGVRAVYTPKDYAISRILEELAALLEGARAS